MERITEARLERTVLRLNKLAGTPITPYNNVDGDFSQNPNCYHLDYCNGGVRLEQTDDTGSNDISPRGTKREIYEWMHAFIKGMEAMRKVAANV